MSAPPAGPRLLSRRRVMHMMALGGLALGLGIEELRHLATQPRLARVHDTRLLMGTIATLTILTDQPEAAQRAIQSAFGRMVQLERVFSRFLANSQLSVLNRTGTIATATPELCQVVALASAFGERTHGAFDVTIEPVLAAYREASQRGRLPDQRTLQDRMARVDYRHVQQRADTITLRRHGMALTLDGLAKGYVLDAGADELIRRGFADVLVEAGGDLIARGMTANGGWRVGIQDPRASAGALIALAQVENAALATSGDYLSNFGHGYMQHHILDPRTGTSPTELSSVTVLAPSACEADALSTALLVLGPTRGLAFIQTVPGAATLLVTKDGEQCRTPGFPTV